MTLQVYSPAIYLDKRVYEYILEKVRDENIATIIYRLYTGIDEMKDYYCIHNDYYSDMVINEIKCVSHPDFISRTYKTLDHDLYINIEVGLSLFQLNNYEYDRYLELIINLEKNKMDIFDKIKNFNIICYKSKYIFMMNYELYSNDYNISGYKYYFDTEGIHDLMFDKFNDYLNMNILFESGYIIDNKGDIYGC